MNALAAVVLLCATLHFAQAEEGQILFSIGHEILNIPLTAKSGHSGQYGVMMEEDNGRFTGIDFNSAGMHYYVSDHERGILFEVSFKEPMCLVSGLGFTDEIAVDWVTGNIYYTSTSLLEIGVCRSDGLFCRKLIKEEFDRPRGLTLDPAEGLLFFSDWGDHFPSIKRAKMDGSNVTVIVETDIVWPNSLTLDRENKRLYWVDGERKTLESVNFDGSNRKVIVSDLTHPYGVVYFKDRLYWTEWKNKVMSADLHSPNHTAQELTKLPMPPYGITIMHPQFQDTSLVDPCSYLNCPYLCVISGANEAQCVCPDQYLSLNGDGMDCLPRKDYVREKIGVLDAGLCSIPFEAGCKSKTNPICQNGGSCKVSQHPVGEYGHVQCSCPEGFSGTYCEVNHSHPVSSWALKSASARLGWLGGLIIASILILLVGMLMVYAVRISGFRPSIFHAKPQLGGFSQSVLFRRRLKSDKSPIVDEPPPTQPQSPTKYESTAVAFDNPCYKSSNVDC